MARHGQPESPRKGTEAGEAVGAVLGQVGGGQRASGEKPSASNHSGVTAPCARAVCKVHRGQLGPHGDAIRRQKQAL